jgi:hypothetical protein
MSSVGHYAAFNSLGRPISEEKMKKKTCKQGHEYTPENTYVRENGYRDCKICRRKQQKKYQKKLSLLNKAFRCPKCGSSDIYSLYRPWFIEWDDPNIPCMEPGESNPCPSDEHLHKVCGCGYWWATKCNDSEEK